MAWLSENWLLVLLIGGVASVYRGKVYRFATRDNRDHFEAAPEQFAKATAGDPLPRRRKGHGGC